MKGIYLINYSVKGVKSLDEWIHLSFYKKTINKDFNIRNYNIKGIYGTNGAGKSGIMTSVKILKNLILDTSYLNNPLVQKQLGEIINKSTQKIEFEVDFIINYEDGLRYYRYKINIGKIDLFKWGILEESLSLKKATSHISEMKVLFHVEDSEIKKISGKNEQSTILIDQTKNLLSASSLCSLSVSKFMNKNDDQSVDFFLDTGIVFLSLFGLSLFVYMDSEDSHNQYFIQEALTQEADSNHYDKVFKMLEHKKKLDRQFPDLLSVTSMSVREKYYSAFVKQVKELESFLKIFKKDLQAVIIDRKAENSGFRCELVMDYGSCTVNAEFESTGIKKLIRLFSYIQKTAEGNIVFIDELDSNLHDVYLCALLEYLMEYGKGQLCFTTHNIGPMDVLKLNKNSIDFLSTDRKIYSWKKNGNYSPSKLYRNGMIEGSPFNIESFDFIGVFARGEDDE